MAMAPPLTLTLPRIELERLHVAQHHGREGLVDLEQVDVVLRHAGLAQHEFGHVDRAR